MGPRAVLSHYKVKSQVSLQDRDSDSSDNAASSAPRVCTNDSADGDGNLNNRQRNRQSVDNRRRDRESPSTNSSQDARPIYDPLLMFRQQQQEEMQRCLEKEQEELKLKEKMQGDDNKPSGSSQEIQQYSMASAVESTSAVASNPYLRPKKTSIPTPSPPQYPSPPLNKNPPRVGSAILNLDLNNINVPSDLIKVLSDLKNQKK